jgi:hypothetical protein
VPQLDMSLDTDLPPEEVRRRLTDFSADRPTVWPGITPDLYEVYEVGEASAEVKEGTRLPLMGAFWARERYDWSDPHTVRWTVVESSFCEPGDYVSATLHPRGGGGTRVELHWQRRPKTLGARIAVFMIMRTKGKLVTDSFRKGLS